MLDWAGGTVLQKLFGINRLAVKPESARGFRVILVIGGLGLAAGDGWAAPCFPRSRALPLASKLGSLKMGFSLGEISGAENRVSEMLPVPLSVIARVSGLPPTCTAPATVREAVSMIETVPSVWLAT